MIYNKIQLDEKKPYVTLTSYILDENNEIGLEEKRPAVLICPGGGYMMCSYQEGEPVAMRFASMGYHAFVLHYSVYCEGKIFAPDAGEEMPPKKDSEYPAALRDIGRAMLTIRRHADDWNVDPDRVALCGFSAGAHNAALYGTSWDRPVLTDFFGVSPETLKPAAVILGYTLSDYVYEEEKLKDPSVSEMARSVSLNSNLALFGCEEPSEEQLRGASPALLVKENTPPHFLWATSEDEQVPVQHSLRMAEALADHHVPFELHIFEKGRHGLSLANRAAAISKPMLNPDAAKWPELAESWLEKRFSIDLPDETDYGRMMRNRRNYGE